jgi:hypothetical protein
MQAENNALRTIAAIAVIAIGLGWMAKTAIRDGVISHFSTDNATADEIIGSGHITDATRPLVDVHAIELDGHYKANISIGDKPEIRIKADDNVIPLVRTETEDGRLTVSTSEKVKSEHDGPELDITVPRLDFLHLETAKATIAGLAGDRFKLEIDGASDVSAAGKVDRVEIEVDGAAKLRLKALEAADMVLRMEGASDAQVTATRSLDVHIDGASTVTYAGSPATVKQEINGVGRVEPEKAEK